MRHLWALPAVLRLALTAPHAFSVHRDILAYPQFDVVFSESFINHDEAQKRLALLGQPSSLDSALDKSSELIQRAHAQPSTSGKDGEDAENPVELFTYEYLVLRSLPHLCTIPIIEQAPDAPKNDSISREEENQDLQRISEHGVELLSGMKGTCLYFIAGWWTYSFCYDKGVKQFHHIPPTEGMPVYPPVEDPDVQSYMLGRFIGPPSQDESHPQNSDVTSTQLQTRGETNYLVRKLDGGTECDLTGRDRRVEVQFHCSPQAHDRIALIKETASCVYLMIIHTPRLCNDVAFLPPKADKPNLITCQQIVRESDIPTWSAIKAAQAKKELFSQGNKQDSSNPALIGGVEVGAKLLVGGDADSKIKPGSIVSGQKADKFIATIASFDGEKIWRMPDKEMAKLGLKVEGSKVIDRWIKKMKEEEYGEPWRLNLMETGRGQMEWVGILGSDKEDGTTDEEKTAAPNTPKNDPTKAPHILDTKKADPTGSASKDKKKASNDVTDSGDSAEEAEGSEEEYHQEL